MWIVFIGVEEDLKGLTPKTPILVLDGPDEFEEETSEEVTPSWLEQALVAATRAEEAAARAEQAEKNITDNFEEIIEDYFEKNPPAVEEAFSPTITMNRVEGGIEITTTNKDGSQTEVLYDGADGQDGKDGIIGKDGAPCVVKSVSEVAGGHNVVFAWMDADGNEKTETMFVQNGESGIHIGTEEPNDPEITVWIDESGEVFP